MHKKDGDFNESQRIKGRTLLFITKFMEIRKTDMVTIKENSLKMLYQLLNFALLAQNGKGAGGDHSREL